jgi:starch synthase (maltosyl-transferring)
VGELFSRARFDRLTSKKFQKRNPKDMPAKSRSKAFVQRPAVGFAPQIYYFHPLIAGPLDSWPKHLRRVQEMGFDTVLAAPIFAPGSTNDLFLAADHENAHPDIATSLTIDQIVSAISKTCRTHDLHLYIDVVLGRVAPGAKLAASTPNWFRPVIPSVQGTDPRGPLAEADAIYVRFDDSSVAMQFADWWIERLCRLAAAGAGGFGCRDPHLVPAPIWRHVTGAVRDSFPHCRFLAWTPGLTWPQIAALRGSGFDAAFSSVAWWDGRAPWLVEEHELLRGLGAVIGSPEAPFGPRLARKLQNSPPRRTMYRHMLIRAVATGDGLLIPAGFEFAAECDMSRYTGAPQGLGDPQALCTRTLAADIKDANALVKRLAQLSVAGAMRTLTGPGQQTTALLRSDAADIRQTKNALVVVINPDLERVAPFSLPLAPLPPTAGVALVADQILYSESKPIDLLSAGEIRVVKVLPPNPMALPPRQMAPTDLAEESRIVIENIFPAVDRGRFAAKRIIGQTIAIEADVFTDGHGLLAVETLWRSVDETEWRRVAMQHLGNDRWQAVILPERVGCYQFAIEAWLDRYGTFCRDLDLKRQAGADINVDIAEGRRLLERPQARAQTNVRKVIASALNWLNDTSVESSADILLSRDLREVMRGAEERPFLHRHEPPLTLEIERPQAEFASWYELFPRSATDRLDRHGNFDDVVRRLPAIHDMGFDVLYLTPIHPIGRRNRKGKNNSLRSVPSDVGSPYAIGSNEGGHDAIHPELGTLDDFRRLRDAAHGYGLELALDFAIQCSPDHPWIKKHPEWFDWRPDGTVRYAENPPKKYEDIVNVDFYAPAAIPGLWYALRNIVLFWAGEGIRIFRVDNPHTKPLPFWEWIIADVRSRYPDVIFLSEAFTRPKMMYRLAKAGFSQSYTYFTWRNTKRELTDYFVELTTTEVKEFFRPHLFVNTPDINPHFLQTSGRPGFLIRAALAATLSGLWGMYSGFEICEAAALPGREEYLNAEKYEIHPRDYNGPGNIIEEISKLNRIRKRHPALQSHLGLRFYPAHNEQIIFYGKPLPAEGDLILAAVSLDPFHVQETTIEVPLWEWHLPDGASAHVHDLMRDTASMWHGKLQRIRLDPADLPFALWRVSPHLGA